MALKLTVSLIAGAALVAGIACAQSGAAPAARPTTHKYEVQMTEDQWKKKLSPHQYQVLREKGTERAFTGKYWDHHGEGVYVCGGCGQHLFSSDHKFESGSGWPSYYQPIAEGKVVTETDTAYGMVRTEILCSNCGGHLGHVFNDGPRPTGERYCVNSASLDFVSEAEVAKMAEKTPPAAAKKPAEASPEAPKKKETAAATK